MSKVLELPAELRNRRQYGLFSDFQCPPPRQVATYFVADLAAGADLSGVIIFAPGRDVIIHNIYLTPDGEAAGIDDSNTSVWSISDGANTLVSQTFDSSTAHPADGEQEPLGEIDFGFLPAAGRLELSVTNGAAANTVATLLSIEFSEAVNYPEPGWKVMAVDDGTAMVDDGAAGVLHLMASGATEVDNDEIYCMSALELFRFAADKPLVAEARLQFTETSSVNRYANVVFGLMDGVAANAMLDDGQGPKASYSGAVMFKVDGGATWQCESSVGAVQTTTQSTKTAGGAAYQTLRIEYLPPVSGSDGYLVYSVDGAQLVDANNIPIKHKIDISSATDMQLVVGVKNGSSAAESLAVDYLGGWQLR